MCSVQCSVCSVPSSVVITVQNLYIDKIPLLTVVKDKLILLWGQAFVVVEEGLHLINITSVKAGSRYDDF